MSLRRTLIMMAAMLAQASPLAAQPLSMTSSLSLNSSYEARGLTFTEHLVVQAAMEATRNVAGIALLAGAWTNLEPAVGGTAGPRMLPAGVGGPSEVNLYGSMTRAVGPAAVELGTIHFLFPAGFDFSEPGLIVELYGTVQLDLPGEPRLAAYYDVSARGWYTELSAVRERAGGNGIARIAAKAGASFGQADAGEYYARDGITHVSVAADYTWTAGDVSFAPALRLTYGVDDATRDGASLRGGRLKPVAGITISWTPRLQ